MKVWGVASEDVGSRADFCSSATAELQGCNECRKCRSIFLPCVALIHAILGVRKLPSSPHGWVHGVPR
ncbi:hypothetical protein EQU24_11500 [Methylotuvimicrobium buryatense]|uniref:Uncharacterized protein n=1 Tax=Methylotuvimicrobium buryatense TaxID=95641 RepID=A0A4P9UNI9_METBY|nr:hypothetical protein EQU24_11500 [Methylotuvimicrobium buryatense]